MASNEYPLIESALDELFVARARWEREGYPNATHSLGMAAVNRALDEYNRIRDGQES